MPVIRRLKLHYGQSAIINHPARFKVASCGRRFGKTMLAGYWLAIRDRGSAVGGKRCAWFAPSYKLLMDAWGDIERSVRVITKRSSKTEQRIELTTGGVIDFWTLEDPDAGRGRRYHRIVIDEAAHARRLKDVWERAISPTLTDYCGDAWFISTPNGINYFSELYRRAEDPENDDWASFCMPSSTNPYLPVEEIESKRLELPELVFRQEYMAEFVTFGAGLVKSHMIRTGQPPVDLQVVLGVDLAISERQEADYTAIVAMARDSSGMVYVLEVERHRCGFHQVIERIKDASARWSPSLIAVEQVQYQAAVVQELSRTTSLPVRGVRPDKDKITRFLPLLTRYERGEVVHDASKVPAWFRDELMSFPNGQHDDGVDAASLAFSTINTQSQFLIA